MKRQLTIAAIIVLSILFLFACSNLLPKGKTSFVTIKIGSDHQKATLHAEQATPWARFKYLLADTKLLPEAYAVIPSNVTSVTVTAQASDMPTQTTTVDTTGGSDVVVTFEVPNGSHREFLVAAFDSNANYAYWSRAFADLNGTAVTLDMQMINLGSVTNLFFVSTSGSDVTGDGTESNPYRTITNAILDTTPPTAILVEGGTYVTGPSGTGESYPLSLAPGTALVCLGPNYSTVLDDTSATASYVPMVSVAAVEGGAPTYIDGCNIYTTQQWTSGVDDGGSTLSVNNSFVNEPLTPSCTSFTSNGINLTGMGSSVTNTKIVANPNCIGLYQNGISVAADVTLSGNSITGAGYGISISAGNPSITNNSITGNVQYGIYSYSPGSLSLSNNSIAGNSVGVYIGDGTPMIDNNTITNNNNEGISASGSPSLNPTITNNALSGNYYGLYLSQSTGTISGNTISNNTGYGIYAGLVGTSSIHNNKLSCNALVDFYLADSTAYFFDLSNNAWDHDTTTTPKGPTISDDSTCPAGVDICYNAALVTAGTPTYTPLNTAVSGGCL